MQAGANAPQQEQDSTLALAAVHQAAYSHMADAYLVDEPNMEYNRLVIVRRVLCNLIPARTTVFEVGCGVGASLRLMCELGFRALGVDVAAGMVAAAAQQPGVPASAVRQLDVEAESDEAVRHAIGAMLQAAYEHRPSDPSRPGAAAADVVFAQAFLHLFPVDRAAALLARLLRLTAARLYLSTTLHDVAETGMLRKELAGLSAERWRCRHTSASLRSLVRSALAAVDVAEGWSFCEYEMTCSHAKRWTDVMLFRPLVHGPLPHLVDAWRTCGFVTVRGLVRDFTPGCALASRLAPFVSSLAGALLVALPCSPGCAACALHMPLARDDAPSEPVLQVVLHVGTDGEPADAECELAAPQAWPQATWLLGRGDAVVLAGGSLSLSPVSARRGSGALLIWSFAPVFAAGLVPYRQPGPGSLAVVTTEGAAPTPAVSEAPASPPARGVAAAMSSSAGSLDEFWSAVRARPSDACYRLLRQDVRTRSWTLFIVGGRDSKPQQYVHASTAAGTAVSSAGVAPLHDPNCLLCPGNELRCPPDVMRLTAEGEFLSGAAAARASATGAPWRVRVVQNSFPLLAAPGELYSYPAEDDARLLATRTPAARGLIANGQTNPNPTHALYPQVDAVGVQEVIIESAMHSAHLGTLPSADVAGCLRVAVMRAQAILSAPGAARLVAALLLVKQQGPLSGGSAQHGHMQLISLPLVPPVVSVRMGAEQRYQDECQPASATPACLVCRSCVVAMLDSGPGSARFVHRSASFVVSVPYNAESPGCMVIAPIVHHADAFAHLAAEPTLIDELANVLHDVLAALARYKNNPDFVMSLQTSPTLLGCEQLGLVPERVAAFSHWSLTIQPRYASEAAKFGGGFAMVTGIIKATQMPEDMAAELRAVLAQEPAQGQHA